MMPFPYRTRISDTLIHNAAGRAAAILPAVALLACLCACSTHRHHDEGTAASGGPEHMIPPAPDHPQLNRFKSLKGRWVESTEGGEHAGQTAAYHVTAGGGTVVETMFPGTPHEMVTMYHLDGDTLMLTHYCVLQNQPRMRAARSKRDDVIQFRFHDSTGMAGAHEPHMHEVVFNFIDDNRFEATWTNYQNGKPAHGVTMNMVRQ